MLYTLLTEETLSNALSTSVIFLIWKGYFFFGTVEAGIRTLPSCVVVHPVAKPCTYSK